MGARGDLGAADGGEGRLPGHQRLPQMLVRWRLFQREWVEMLIRFHRTRSEGGAWRVYQIERLCRLGGIGVAVVGREGLYPYKVRQAVVGRACRR